MLTITSQYDKKTGKTEIEGNGSTQDLAVMIGNIARAVCKAIIDTGENPDNARECTLDAVEIGIRYADDTPCDPPLTARERRLTDRIEEQADRIEQLYNENDRLHKAYEDALDKRFMPCIVEEIMNEVKEELK